MKATPLVSLTQFAVATPIGREVLVAIIERDQLETYNVQGVTHVTIEQANAMRDAWDALTPKEKLRLLFEYGEQDNTPAEWTK